MTRINCIPVKQLTREHLHAEYKEIHRISKLARPNPDAPTSYTMGKGHCIFFYDKGKWLKNRLEKEIVPRLEKEFNYKLSFKKYRTHPRGLNNDWQPTRKDMAINRKRIRERLNK